MTVAPDRRYFHDCYRLWQPFSHLIHICRYRQLITDVHNLLHIPAIFRDIFKLIQIYVSYLFLAVTWIGGENGNVVCLWKDDSQEHISLAMNTIMGILILQFPFFKYNRNILGFIFDITPLYNCPFLHLCTCKSYWKLSNPYDVLRCCSPMEEEAA